jgi:uncharacterized membrane protein
MSRILLAALIGVLGVASMSFGQTLSRSTGAVRLRPAQPELSEEAVAALKQQYDQLSDDEKAEMVAVYKDMGIDLLALFGVGEEGAAAPEAAPAAPAQTLVQAVQALDFSRTPQKVLDARAQLGLQAPPMPGEDAEVAELAGWMHKHVMSGEWSAFDRFLDERAGEDAEQIYAHVLQSTNQGDPQLLPEEILAISEAAPGEITDWQLDVLAQLLKTAAAKSSTGPLLDRIRQGTTYFGDDEARRERTARFLSMAGLPVEAYAYLPPLDEARADGDAQAIIDHARYQAARAQALGSRPEAEAHRRTAWELYCDVTLIEDADFELRRSSLKQAIDLLPSVPPGPGAQWLRRVFANAAIAPAALEAVALKAMSINDQKTDIAERAQAILTMKDAVDTLLDQENVDIEQIRVPLRMLTLALVSAAEETIQKRAPMQGVAAETTLLLRALPGEPWRATIEDSLAVRAYQSFIGIALIADDTDLALDLLAQGVERAPGQSVEMADEFLRLWMIRLNPPRTQAQNQFVIYFGRTQRPSAPLTRGRQRRNLDRLTRLLDVLDSIGADGRRLERVVDVFGACHGRAEAYQRDSIIEVLGTIDELAPGVAARMADAMRSGLNGDWRSREVQRDEGSQRNQSQIDTMVEEGYELALDLIESAIAQEPDSWRHAMTKTALSYDLMQFRGERDQDAAAYNDARAELFRSFAGAASRYQSALARGEVRADVSVYLTWFGISLGSSTLSGLTAEDLLTEAAENESQLEAIRSEMLAMDPDAAQLHFGEFAREVIDALPSMTPEVKPGVVRRAVAIVGDHPAAAPLRRTLDLYEDLVSDEIQLRLAIDGSERVGTRPFGAVLTIRYAASIEREIGGFAQYLQNNIYTYINGQYQSINLRDRLEKSIAQEFDGMVELVEIGFFHSMNPAEPIQVEGGRGWEEKPIAYLVLRAVDESADHIPALQMDLNLMDSSGPVVLPVRSNTVLIDAVNRDDLPRRTAKDLVVTQTLDMRHLENDEGDRHVMLEVTAVGRGVVPSLRDLLDGLDGALEGYRIAEDGVQEEPISVAVVQPAAWQAWYAGGSDEDDTYVKADEDGLFRLTTSKTWKITYEPTVGGVGDAFTVPVLADGVEGTLSTDRYVDMDLVAVSSASAPVHPSGMPWGLMVSIVLLLIILAVIAFMALWRRRGEGEGDALDVHMPDRVTPLTAVITLQRIDSQFGSRLGSDERESLRGDIAELERVYFAEDGSLDGRLGEILDRWIGRMRGEARQA